MGDSQLSTERQSLIKYYASKLHLWTILMSLISIAWDPIWPRDPWKSMVCLPSSYNHSMKFILWGWCGCMKRDIQELALKSTGDRSSWGATSSRFLCPTSKSKLEAESVYFGPAWGRSMICKVDLLLPCLPWQPLRAAHWLLPQMSTVLTHNHTRTHTPTGTYGSFSVTFSICYCGIPLLASKHPPLSPVISAGEVLLLQLIFFSLLLVLLAPEAGEDGRRFLLIFNEQIWL